MKDYFGNVLEIGQEVAFVHPYIESKRFMIGKVIDFTPKMVKVQYNRGRDLCDSYILKSPDGLIIKK